MRIQRKFHIIKAVVVSITLVAMSGCSDDSSTDPNITSDASYKVTFTSTWISTNFPTEFPGGAHFSGLVGGTHNNQVRFWESGQLATDGIQSMAETGAKSGLLDEIGTAITEGKAEFMLSGSGNSAIGTVELEFDINVTYPLVTLVSMVAPSPDWFVGVRDLSLYDNTAGDWINTLTMNLKVYDAGSDSGLSFASANTSTQPADPILLLTSTPADTDFVDGVGPAGEFIATMTFERIK